jgi:hypothetical protein
MMCVRTFVDTEQMTETLLTYLLNLKVVVKIDDVCSNFRGH